MAALGASMTTDRSCRNLLLAAVPDSGDPDEIRALAGAITDWNPLIDLALQHRVLPTLFLRMAEMQPYVPASALSRMQREYDRSVLHNLANAAELIAVLRQFNAEGIPAIPFKGIVLAASVYGDLQRRPGGDLDFLVREKDLVRSSEILRARGYELAPSVPANETPAETECHEYKFLRHADGMVLELRWRLDLNPRFGRDLGFEWAWRYHSTADLAGASVPILNPQISLLVLCMHGCKHNWSRLAWVCDIAKLIAASPHLDWHLVLTQSKRLGLTRSVGLGILLAEKMFQAKVPHWVLGQFEADNTIRKLAHHFSENVLQNPGLTPEGRVPYGTQLLDFEDRLRMFLSWNFLQPGEKDRQMFGLPGWLHPLYYLLRPLRLLWDRSPR